MNARRVITRFLLPAGAVALAAALAAVRAQPTGHALDFTTTQYFEPPHQQQVKSILSGAEAVARPGQPYLIHQFRLQTFDVNGRTNMIVTGPECFYNEKACTASSAGPLEVQNGDGSFHVAGDGFLWRQTNSLLTISNNVRTVIKYGAKMTAWP